MRAAISVLFVIMIGTLTACGVESTSGSGSNDAADAAEAAQASEDAVAAERLVRKTQQFKKCAKLSQQLNTKLTDLDSRLSVGMPFADYGKAVGDVRVAYDRLFRQMGDGGAEDLPCLAKVIAPLEAAFNAYVAAYNVWNDCINDTYCSMEGSTLEKAQGSWSKATRQISRAERGLSALNPAD